MEMRQVESQLLTFDTQVQKILGYIDQHSLPNFTGISQDILALQALGLRLLESD